MDSVKSNNSSASASNSSLESNSSYISLLSHSSTTYWANSPVIVDDVPITVSPGINPETVVPIPTWDILRVPVSSSQSLTLASVPELCPWTTSLK